MKKLFLISIILLAPVAALAFGLDEFQRYAEAADLGFMVVLAIAGAIPGAAAVLPFLTMARKTTKDIVDIIDTAPVSTKAVFNTARQLGKTAVVKQMERHLPRANLKV